MGTTIVEAPLVVRVPAEILGPESEYEKRRIALTKQYEPIIDAARLVKVVNSPESLEHANNLGRILQTGGKDCEAFFKPIKQSIDAIKAPVLAAENTFKNALEAEKKNLGNLITVYNRELDRQRAEEERQQREVAEQQAREEVLNRAVELDVSGDTEGAAALLEEPVMAPVVIQQKAPAKMSGQVSTTRYSCIVDNVKALMQAVLEGKAPMACFTVDQSFLNKKADLDKDGFNLPGCRLHRESGTHFRS